LERIYIYAYKVNVTYKFSLLSPITHMLEFTFVETTYCSWNWSWARWSKLRWRR